MRDGAAPTRRRGLARPVRRGVLGFLAAFVVLYFGAPQIAGARKALHLLGHVNLAYLGLGAALEAGAIVAYALLTRAVLPAGSPPLATLVRINLSTLALSHVVPGGTAGGTGLGYRLLTDTGVEKPDAGFALATQGLGSAVVLNVVLWLALLVSIPLRGFNPLYATAALVGVVLFAAFGALVALLTRGQARAAAVLAALARRLPFLNERTVTNVVHRLAERLAELGKDHALVRRAIAWAAANWLLDAASLWVFLVAFGRVVDPDALLVAYGLANVLAAIPVTPGGLGVVEGVATSVLVGFHTPRGVAILAVLGWRLVNFWLPIPAGAFAYLSLRLEPGAGTSRRREELERLAEEAAEAARLAHKHRGAPPPPGSPAR